MIHFSITASCAAQAIQNKLFVASLCSHTMPTQSRGKRTRTGCWTCRKRGKKCDETRPGCNNCTALSLQCAGYATRLRWNHPQLPAICDSGKLAPYTESTETTQIEQTRATAATDGPDSAALLYHLGQEAYQALTDTERCLMHDCKARFLNFMTVDLTLSSLNVGRYHSTHGHWHYFRQIFRNLRAITSTID